MPDEIIPPLNRKTRLTKEQLVESLNAFYKINEINKLYAKFYESPDERPVLAAQIEAQFKDITSVHSKLFADSDTEKSKVDKLNKQIEEIQKYHTELISSNDSIAADIKDSQDKITDFYNELFDTDETEGDGGKQARLKIAIDSIVNFNETLNKTDTGYRAKIENAKDEILKAYDNLFAKDRKTALSKIEALSGQIAETNTFHEKMTNEIAPFIDEKRDFIDKVSEDIKTKQTEVDSLLSETTTKTLLQSYREAMQLYGAPVYTKSKLGNLWKSIKHFATFVGSYLLFVGPLVIIGWVFVDDSWKNILNIQRDGSVNFSGSEYIAYKLTIALPLLWVSWYGQKNISHRKRLFEEYNHKLRVVQMYLLFMAKESYELGEGSRQRLEDTLQDTISRNPSQVYGKDETLIDKIFDFVREVRGVTNDNKPGTGSQEPTGLSTALNEAKAATGGSSK